MNGFMHKYCYALCEMHPNDIDLGVEIRFLFPKIKIVIKHPNDADLGNAFRSLINTKNKQIESTKK